MLANLYADGTFVNQASNGKHPFDNLVRLDAQLLASSPDLVMSPIYQVMDTDLDPKCAEAIVRRIWTELPTARQVVVLIPECDAGLTAVLDLSTQKAQCKAMYEYYGIPVIDFDDFCQTNIGDLATYMADQYHPTATGQTQITTMTTDYFTAHPTFLTTTPDHSILPAVYITGVGEYTTAAQRIHGNTGTETGAGWGNVGTYGRQSATAGDTISFTAEMVAFGVYDIPGTNPEFQISIDGGAYFAPSGGAGRNGYSTPFETRAEHTIGIKVISGTLRIDEFWAI